MAARRWRAGARPAGQFPEPTVQRLLPVGGPQRLEQPLSGGAVAAQDMVIEAKPPRWQLPGAARRWRPRQHLAAEAEAQVADPAAAEGGTCGIRGPCTWPPGVASAAVHAALGPGDRGKGRVKDISERPGGAAHQPRPRPAQISATTPAPEKRTGVRTRPH